MCIVKIMFYEHISMFLNMLYSVENVISQVWFLLLLALSFVQFNETFIEFCAVA